MTHNYIAMPGLSVTENLGSQMWHFATLFAISRRTGHRILFFSEYENIGKGLKLHHHFPSLPIELQSIADMTEADRCCLLYQIPNDIIVDSNVFQLDPRQNYNFQGLFISYKYWYPIRNQVAKLYQFDPLVIAQAEFAVAKARRDGRHVVAVHVRRDDYINGVFINVTRDYYDAAFSFFDPGNTSYLVFSDDLAWCRQAFQGRNHFYYSDATSPIVDMCAMSLCDHNVIANSSFGFWGAFLNQNPNKRMICPAKTLKSDKTIPHLNYAWHPDEFIGLDIGNL